MPPAKKVAIVTLGCARNEVDSEELAGRLSVGGWDLVENAEAADAVLVNTCGFIEAAKRESIDTVLSLAGDDAPAVIATGCLAERYGTELAASLPEARAVLGFDDYPEIAARLDAVMRGEDVPAPVPTDRRT
ncbi:MAG: 30S ribosomal protein S12 methylthiotransferase RimO, partial [Actinomycetota bacterium]